MSVSCYRAPSTMLPPLVPSAGSAAVVKPPGSFFMPAPVAQQRSAAQSPAEELADQPFDTGAPAQILAEESPVRDAPLVQHQDMQGPPQDAGGLQAEHPQISAARQSSGFGQWLSNGAPQAQSQGSEAAPQASGAPQAPFLSAPGVRPGAQLMTGSGGGQPWMPELPQAAFQGAEGAGGQSRMPKSMQLGPQAASPGGDLYSSYASVVPPAQHASYPAAQAQLSVPGQAVRPLSAGSPSGPSFGSPAAAGVPAAHGDEMREIEL